MNIPYDAIKRERCLEVSYDGYVRVVEVHAYGITKDSNAVMRVFQIRGGSNSNEPVGWKLLRLDEVAAMRILEGEISQAPRAGYRRGDSAMNWVLCQV